jgi:hypothetical protein
VTLHHSENFTFFAICLFEQESALESLGICSVGERVFRVAVKARVDSVGFGCVSDAAAVADLCCNVKCLNALLMSSFLMQFSYEKSSPRNRHSSQPNKFPYKSIIFLAS